MNWNAFRFVLLAFFLLYVAAACKSHKKVAAITNVSTDKKNEDQNLRKQQEDELRKKELEEKAKLEAMRESTPKAKLGQYFEAISTSATVTSANGSINEALTMFSSPEAPVLIVISEERGEKDYDKPTTIREYLNYLKDQKKNVNRIENVKVDEYGKITEVELRKVN